MQPPVQSVQWPQHPGAGDFTGEARNALRPPPSWKADQYDAVHDDSVGHKLRDALSEAAVEYGRVAVHQGAHLAKKAAIAIYVHAEASAWTVKGIAFTVAIAMLVVSLLSLFNVFYAMAHPLYYVLATYDFAFALIILIMEGPSELNCESCGTWSKLQNALFGWAAFLASRTGRALFYFFVGTLNMFMMPHDWLWTLIYFMLGAALTFVGLLSLMDRYGCTRVCCPGMRNHVRGKLHETDFHQPDHHGIANNHGIRSNSPTGRVGSPSRIQEMEKLLDAELGSRYP